MGVTAGGTPSYGWGTGVSRGLVVVVGDGRYDSPKLFEHETGCSPFCPVPPLPSLPLSASARPRRAPWGVASPPPFPSHDVSATDSLTTGSYYITLLRPTPPRDLKQKTEATLH